MCSAKEPLQDRWQRILDDPDHALLWQAVNWRGEVSRVSPLALEVSPAVDLESRLYSNGVFNSPGVLEQV